MEENITTKNDEVKEWTGTTAMTYELFVTEINNETDPDHGQWLASVIIPDLSARQWNQAVLLSIAANGGTSSGSGPRVKEEHDKTVASCVNPNRSHAIRLAVQAFITAGE